MVASISDGEIPQWLFDTYSTDGTADTMDLDRLWSDVKAFPDIRSEVAYGLHNVFGGYCSDKEAIAAHGTSAPVYKNPWVQGGCETRWPRDLAAAAGGSGTISVNWTAPYYATTPTINAYVVQWKGDGEQYDSARQALVTDLSSLSYTITGLISGEQYSVRVVAVNQADTADFVDDDGRTRAPRRLQWPARVAAQDRGRCKPPAAGPWHARISRGTSTSRREPRSGPARGPPRQAVAQPQRRNRSSAAAARRPPGRAFTPSTPVSSGGIVATAPCISTAYPSRGPHPAARRQRGMGVDPLVQLCGGLRQRRRPSMGTISRSKAVP